MNRISWVFLLWLGFFGRVWADSSVTVLQAYHSHQKQGTQVDLLLALPEGVAPEDLSAASVSFQGSASYCDPVFDFYPRYDAALGGIVSHFVNLSGCYSGGVVTLRIGSAEYRSRYVNTTSYHPSYDSPCRKMPEGCDPLVEIPAQAARQKQREAEDALPPSKDDELEDQLEFAGERFVKRLTGETALRHPALLGSKTAYTLGRLGVRYEPIGFFTVGIAERLDLGLGVRSFRAGEENLFFPGAELKAQVIKESHYLPAVAVSASGNTLMKDRTLPQGTGGLRLGASAYGFEEQAQQVGDTQFALGLHASKHIGQVREIAGKPNLTLHAGTIYTKTQAAKGNEAGASLYTGDDLIVTGGFDVTGTHNFIAFLGEATYSVASERFDVSAAFRLSLAGVTADLGVGFTGEEQAAIDGQIVTLPPRFFPRLGLSYLF